MPEDKIINIDDINYAVYKIGDWKNNYEINQMGLSHEIPVTENTINHVKLSMKEIRASQFSIGDEKVNGFVAIAFQLNSELQDRQIKDIIELEETEYENILQELDALDVLSNEDTISLENEEYLIYKLEKHHHLTVSIPANEFTEKFYNDEIERIENTLG